MSEGLYNRTFHVLALLTAVATFPLIFMGGLVTSHGAGMSVPDWPNSYGYNMFTFPPSLWIGGILYEHTHRLMGTVVGMLSIALVVVAWRVELRSFARRLAARVVGRNVPPPERGAERRWVQWLCVGVLIAVIVQGVLGGLRVVLVQLDLAIVHACLAQAFFCLAAFAAVVTSKWWLNAPDLSQSSDREHGRQLGVACLVTVALIFGQLIVGAMMRHHRAGLAVPDFPLAYGQLIPATNAAALAEINTQRVWTLQLDAVTAAQVWLHLGHRIGALLVTLSIAALAWMVFRHHRFEWSLRGPVVILMALLIVQVTLGALTVLWRKPADVASIHVAVGALTLVTAFVLTVRTARLYERRRDVAAESPSLTFESEDRHGSLAAA